MVDIIQYLGSWQALEPEVVKAMLDLAQIGPGDKFIDLGCGDGQFLIEAEARGATATGIELDPSLVSIAEGKGLNVIEGNVFDADVSKATVVTFWFTDTELTPKLMDKLYAEMKKGAQLIYVYHSGTAYRNGILVPEECLRQVPHIWQPVESIEVIDNWIHRCVR